MFLTDMTQPICGSTQNGNIDIDAPIAQYVDDIMWRLNHTTMSALWGGNPMVNNITARRLMGMRAGLHDYNDTWWEHLRVQLAAASPH